MGATLADGGLNPLTKQRVVDPVVCHYALSVMATAGLYETSGDWLYDIGLPGKSGIGGGIVTVSPGKGGLAQSRPNAARHLIHRDRVVEATLTAIRQGDDGHGLKFSPLRCRPQKRALGCPQATASALFIIW